MAGIAFFPPEAKLIRNITFIILGLVLIIIAGFRQGDSVRDYDGYVIMFQNKSDTIIEPSFALISFLVHALLGDNSIYLFIIFAILGVSLKFVAIKQLTELWFLSVLIYFSNFFILHEMTQIRVGVASALMLLCVKPIYDRNLKYFLLFALLAFSFHFSALMILPLWFLNNKPQKKWLVVLIPISYLIFFLGINLITSIPIPGVHEKIEIYQKLQEIGDEAFTNINLFNLVFLTKIAIFYFLIYKYELLLSYNKYFSILMKMYCISLISYPIFATIPAFATRINELYGVVDFILIPFLYYVFKPIYFSRAIVVFIGLSLILIVLFYVKLIVY
jgi:hypothetical protein